MQIVETEDGVGTFAGGQVYEVPAGVTAGQDGGSRGIDHREGDAGVLGGGAARTGATVGHLLAVTCAGRRPSPASYCHCGDFVFAGRRATG
ncbi:hypothetical protein [Nocardia asiatica]|uniref:hypothetical protein n=1 Tax=Nocardia asiatica TaxID=209252 RepID=UPI0024545631|nr:hypothetical protein [Nocardia asiatica]